MKEEIAKELSSALGNIRLAERGVYVQASTLGALEALLDFLKSSKIPVSARSRLSLLFISMHASCDLDEMSNRKMSSGVFGRLLNSIDAERQVGIICAFVPLRSRPAHSILI